MSTSESAPKSQEIREQPTSTVATTEIEGQVNVVAQNVQSTTVCRGMEPNPQDSLVTSSGEIENETGGSLLLSDTSSNNTKKKKMKLNKKFPWFNDFQVSCQSLVGNDNFQVLLNLIISYTQNVSKEVLSSYTKPKRASTLKENLITVIGLFHNCYNNIHMLHEEGEYKDQMSALLTMYMDMEIKASRLGTDSVQRIGNKVVSAMFIVLNGSPEYILDSILNGRYITVKKFQDICIPIFKKVTSDLHSDHELTYVRFLLIFKLWKCLVDNGTERNVLNRVAVTKLNSPPPQLLKMIQKGMLSEVLPNIPPNKNPKLVTRFYLLARFDLRPSIKEFMKLKADFQVNKITSTLNTSDILDKDMFGQENLTISDKDCSSLDSIKSDGPSHSVPETESDVINLCDDSSDESFEPSVIKSKRVCHKKTKKKKTIIKPVIFSKSMKRSSLKENKMTHLLKPVETIQQNHGHQNKREDLSTTYPSSTMTGDPAPSQIMKEHSDDQDRDVICDLSLNQITGSKVALKSDAVTLIKQESDNCSSSGCPSSSACVYDDQSFKLHSMQEVHRKTPPPNLTKPCVVDEEDTQSSTTVNTEIPPDTGLDKQHETILVAERLISKAIKLVINNDTKATQLNEILEVFKKCVGELNTEEKQETVTTNIIVDTQEELNTSTNVTDEEPNNTTQNSEDLTLISKLESDYNNSLPQISNSIDNVQNHRVLVKSEIDIMRECPHNRKNMCCVKKELSCNNVKSNLVESEHSDNSHENDQAQPLSQECTPNLKFDHQNEESSQNSCVKQMSKAILKSCLLHNILQEDECCHNHSNECLFNNSSSSKTTPNLVNKNCSLEEVLHIPEAEAGFPETAAAKSNSDSLLASSLVQNKEETLNDTLSLIFYDNQYYCNSNVEFLENKLKYPLLEGTTQILNNQSPIDSEPIDIISVHSNNSNESGESYLIIDEDFADSNEDVNQVEDLCSLNRANSVSNVYVEDHLSDTVSEAKHNEAISNIYDERSPYSVGQNSVEYGTPVNEDKSRGQNNNSPVISMPNYNQVPSGHFNAESLSKPGGDDPQPIGYYVEYNPGRIAFNKNDSLLGQRCKGFEEPGAMIFNDFTISPIANTEEVYCSAYDATTNKFASGHPELIDNSHLALYPTTPDQYLFSPKTVSDKCYTLTEMNQDSSLNTLELEQVNVKYPDNDSNKFNNVHDNNDQDEMNQDSSLSTLELDQVHVEYSNKYSNKLNNDHDNNLHTRTLYVDSNSCESQNQFEEFCKSQGISPMIPIPYPFHPPRCNQCSSNRTIFLDNYNLLINHLFRNPLAEPIDNYSVPSNVSFAKESCNIDCKLPIKKRKTMTNCKCNGKPMPYPNKTMISIAEVAIPTFDQQNVINVSGDREEVSKSPLNFTQYASSEKQTELVRSRKRKKS